MKIVTNLFTSLIFTFWISVIAVVSIQNTRAISLRFLWFESIQFPLGVLLTFSVGFGIIIGAFLPLFLTKNKRNKKRYIPRPPEVEEYIPESKEYDPIEDWEDFEAESW